jgi:hypothetical protein
MIQMPVAEERWPVAGCSLRSVAGEHGSGRVAFTGHWPLATGHRL